jgi:Holliday junction resolvasome RuvABC endonuclease subunit
MSRISIDEIRNACEQQGWKLITEKYKNLTTQMEFVCPQQHTVYTTYEKFRKNPICPICARKVLDTTEEIKKIPKKNGLKRTFAIDQATHTSGWAVFDGSNLVKFGKYTTKDYDDIDLRINDFKQYLINMIEFWSPDLIILEDIQLQQFGPKSSNNIQGVTTYKGLAKLQGVLINLFIEYGIEYQIVHTGTWREACGIKGKSRSERKKSAQLIVQEIYGVNPTQDEADAICIGLYITQRKEKNASMISWE